MGRIQRGGGGGAVPEDTQTQEGDVVKVQDVGVDASGQRFVEAGHAV